MTHEPQYDDCFRQPRIELGPMASDSWLRDPKHLCFVLARYKFVAKMVQGCGYVLEVGCGDAFGSRIVRQHVKDLVVSDFDVRFVNAAVKASLLQPWTFHAIQHDFIAGPLRPDDPHPVKRWAAGLTYDAVYAIDVLEHIPREIEHSFIGNVIEALHPNGWAIFGMPSLESQAHASPISKQGHVNCKSSKEFEATMGEHFESVLMFSMNDETLHTGYHAMSHYLFAVCSGLIK